MHKPSGGYGDGDGNNGIMVGLMAFSPSSLSEDLLDQSNTRCIVQWVLMKISTSQETGEVLLSLASPHSRHYSDQSFVSSRD